MKALASSRSIGLDIGSSAVRAVEVSIGRGRPKIIGFGQVGLPPTAVIDGEIHDAVVVADALRHLWRACAFSSRHVILGVSGTRVVVRQAAIPAVAPDEIRSALDFAIEDLVPLPASDVEFDAAKLAGVDHVDSRSATPEMPILLAAAHGEVLRGHLEVAQAAGLVVDAIEPVPLSLLRVAGPNPSDAVDAVVSIGANLSVVAIREGSSPAFIRMIGRGASDLVRAIGEAADTPLAHAEALLRAGSTSSTAGGLIGGLAREQARLLSELRGTIDFYEARPESGGARVQRVALTGGGSRLAGLPGELAGVLGVQVVPLSLVGGQGPVEVGGGLDWHDANDQVAAAAVGLALWPTSRRDHRLNLLPRALVRRRQVHAARTRIAAGVGVLVVLIGAAGAARYLQVEHARSGVASETRLADSLERRTSTYSSVTALRSEVAADRVTAAGALTGDTNWAGLLQRIAAAQPSTVQISSFTGSSASSDGVTTTGTGGSVTISATSSAGVGPVSSWIVDLERVPGLQDLWVNSVQSGAVATGSAAAKQDQFSASAVLGAGVGSDRAAKLPGGR